MGLFLDLFNTFQLEHGSEYRLGSGASFEKAATVLGPRIAKFGVKFDW